MFTSRVKDGSANNVDVSAFALDRTVDLGAVTFDTKPALGYRIGSVNVAGGTLTERRMDVTDGVRVKAGTTFSVAFSAEPTADGKGHEVQIQSMRSSTKPVLVVQLAPKQGSTAPTAPVITSAVSSTSSGQPGTVTGTVSGPAGTDLRVVVARVGAFGCVPVVNAGDRVASTTVRTDAAGTARFTVPAALAVGSSVIATAFNGAVPASAVSACAPVSATAGATAGTVLSSSGDAYVQGASTATVNFSRSLELFVLNEKTGSANNRTTYMNFDLAELEGRRIQSARLSFLARQDNTASTTAVQLKAHALAAQVELSTVTFATAPAPEYTIGQAPVIGANARRTMDLTDYVRQRAGDAVSVGISADPPPTGGAGLVVISSTRSLDKPVLEVTFAPETGSVAPGAPVIESAVSTARDGAPGVVSGVVEADPGTSVTVEVVTTGSAGCVPVLRAGSSIGTATVVAGQDGRAPWSVTAPLAAGVVVMAGASAGDVPAAGLSPCTTVGWAPGNAERISVPSAGDAYVQDGSVANTTFNRSAELWAYTSTKWRGGDKYSYMNFDTGSIDPGDIESAEIRFTAGIKDSAATPVTLAAHAVAGRADLSTLTYSNRPALDVRVGSTVVSGPLASRSIDVTDYLRLAAGGPLQLAFAAEPTSDGLGINVQIQSMRTSLKPVLVIQTKPDAMDPAPGAPSIASIQRRTDDPGLVALTGSVSGLPGSEVTVRVALAPASGCVPVLAAGTMVGETTITLDESGTGGFETSVAVPAGRSVYAGSSSGRIPGSGVSDCIAPA